MADKWRDSTETPAGWIDKPPVDSRVMPVCSKCGRCCKTYPCIAGRMLGWDDDGQCPGYSDVTGRCNVMAYPHQYDFSLAREMMTALNGKCNFRA